MYSLDDYLLAPYSVKYLEAFSGTKTGTEIAGNALQLLQSVSTSNGFTGDLTSGGTGTEERGWRFTVGPSSITVIGIRVKAYTTESITAHLWKVSDSSLVASVNISAVANSWVTGTFENPVTLEANTDYIVSAPGYYGYRALASTLTFNSAITYVTGRYGTANTLPANSWANNVCAADIIIGSSTYTTSGTYESDAISVGDKDIKLGGSIVTPANTSVTIQYATGAVKGDWITIEIGETFTPDTNVWLKYTLETADTSVSPSVENIYLLET